MRHSVLALVLALCALSASAVTERVVYVDNRAEPGGNGNAEHPFVTIGEAIRRSNPSEVIFVAETDRPYREDNLTLKRGQLLVGSSYGLEAVRTDLHTDVDAPTTPAARGAGPLIEGSVILSGDNAVAGMNIASSSAAALAASSATGPITVVSTNIRTAKGAIGIALNSLEFPATITGCSLTGEGGAGIVIYAGRGEVVFDRFTLGGTFTSVLDIRNREGAVTFRGRGAIDVADATQPAVTIADCTARVAFELPLRVAAHARVLAITNSKVRIAGDGSRLSAAAGNALEVHDSTLDVSLAAVSAAAGGIVIDKIHGSLAVTGQAQQPGSGGTVAKTIDVTQSENVRLANMSASALHLRHLAHSAIENVDTTGLYGSNIEDLRFDGLHVRGSAVLDEIKQKATFSRCTFEDGALQLTQQFNTAKVVFETCMFSAAGQPAAATHLLIVRAQAIGKLDVALRNCEMHDNAASALRGEASGTSALTLGITDSRFERLGRAAIEVAAREQARAAFVLRGTTVLTPGTTDSPAVDVTTAGAATVCADLIGNQVVNGGAVPAVRIPSTAGACH